MIIAIVVIILTVVLYSNFESILLDVTKTSNQQKLAQIRSNTEQANNDINRFIVTLFNNNDISLLMYSKNLNQVTSNDLLTKIDTLLSSTSYAYSLHIINLQNNEFKTIGPFFATTESFFDDEIIESLKNIEIYTSPLRLTRVMPTSPFKSTANENVISYVVSDSVSISNKPLNALVLNVKTDWLFDTINYMNVAYSGNKESIFVIDHTGVAIAHQDKQNFMKDMSDQDYIKRIISNKSDSSFITGKGNAKQLITYSYCESLDWYIVSSIPFDFISEVVNTYRFLAVLIGLFILFSGILLSLIISRKLYLPLDNLGKTVKRLTGDQIISETNEFTFVSNAFENIVNSVGELKIFKNSNLSLVKNDLLRELLRDNFSEIKQLSKKFEECNSNLDLHSYISLIILKIDNYEDFCEKHNLKVRNILLFAMGNIACEIISSCYKCESTDLEGDHAVIFINVSDQETEDILIDKLCNLIQEVQKNIQKHLEFSVSASISPLSISVSEISDSYHQSLESLDKRFKVGHGCIINTKAIVKTNEDYFELPMGKIKILIDSIKLSKSNQFIENYDNIIKYISYSTSDDIRFCLTFLFSNIYEALNVMHSNGNKLLDIDFKDFSHKINTLETLSQINDEFYKLFEILASRKQSDNKTEKFVSVAKEIIDNNYYDYNICTDYVASQLKMSPVYLRKAFKEATFMSISEYINEVRLKKAKEFLTNSSMNVEEIIDKIGWENKKYFFIIFKKNFGVTPSQYRMNNMDAS
jgi:AraC-like DNA-binding protein